MIEPNTNSNQTHKTALCFLARRPNACMINIAQQLHEQIPALSDNIYIMIDDDTYELDDEMTTRSKIHFLKIDKEICIQHGFKNSILLCINKYQFDYFGLPPLKTLVTAWDKAIFYFIHMNTKYGFVWFIEDDVFIPSIECIRLLNDEYSTASDLVCAENIVNSTGEFNPNWNHYDPLCPIYDVNGEFGPNWWWYDMPRLRFSLPWHGSLLCVMGTSRRLLEEVDKFIKDREELGFVEFVLPTLAIHAHLRFDNPSTLKNTIHWKHPWTLDDIIKQPANFFHPCKEFDKHDDWRKKLKETIDQ